MKVGKAFLVNFTVPPIKSAFVFFIFHLYPAVKGKEMISSEGKLLIL